MVKLMPGLKVYGGDDRVDAMTKKVSHSHNFKVRPPNHVSGESCGSGGRAGCPLTAGLVVSISGSSCPHVEVSCSKIPNVILNVACSIKNFEWTRKTPYI